ncbi:MAG: element excision factor XisI family protein [Coleofasciculus sp.]|uniref:element excision factor XisI family protein n=1 Tax=Coleofasciculus sp. TaxID=3100458 RepID=UPI003A214E57
MEEDNSEFECQLIFDAKHDNYQLLDVGWQGLRRVYPEALGSDMQVKNNDGGTEIVSNLIGNNLQCQDNDPAPTGGGNTAAQKQGQCENL